MTDSEVKAEEISELDPGMKQRLSLGEVILLNEPVAGSPAPKYIAWAVLEAPPDHVWKLIDQVANYKNVMKGVTESEEISRQDGVVTARVTLGMPFPLPNLVSVTEGVHTVIPGKLYQRKWHLIDGDYQVNSGSWTLVPFDGDPNRTLAQYQLHAEPNILIPRALQKLGQKTAFPRVIEQLRRLARK
jgi:ribosome-associated toxin RatA of RatAB toxin-antitoxin module